MSMMKTCMRFRPLLPLSAGGDLDAASEQDLRAHLAVCPACNADHLEFIDVISAGRAAFRGDHALPAGLRRRMAAVAAEEARRAPLWARLVPVPGLPGARPGLALASAAALLVILVAVPISLRNRPETAVAERIDMKVQDGKVLLAWSDGARGSYKVSKSSDPRGLSGTEVHTVRGNVWVDTDPESSPIVFYRIE
jgi:hypothetical protein